MQISILLVIILLTGAVSGCSKDSSSSDGGELGLDIQEIEKYGVTFRQNLSADGSTIIASSESAETLAVSLDNEGQLVASAYQTEQGHAMAGVFKNGLPTSIETEFGHF